MKLTKDQLNDYLENMAEKRKKALENDFNIHGYMIYQCEECNSIYVMWLAEGLEDSSNDAKTGNHKPVPFEITCPYCGGGVHHKHFGVGAWTLGTNYRSYKEYVSQQNKLLYRNFFWNDPESDCGIPIIFSPDYPMVSFEQTSKRVLSIIWTTEDEFMHKERETLVETTEKQ